MGPPLKPTKDRIASGWTLRLHPGQGHVAMALTVTRQGGVCTTFCSARSHVESGAGHLATTPARADAPSPRREGGGGLSGCDLVVSNVRPPDRATTNVADS